MRYALTEFALVACISLSALLPVLGATQGDTAVPQTAN